jgi:HEAT repeat protein
LGSLALLGDSAAEDELLALLNDEEMQHWAAFALARLPNEAALPICLESVDSRYYNVRLGAIRALQNLGGKKSITKLHTLRSDPSYEIRRAAQRALHALES